MKIRSFLFFVTALAVLAGCKDDDKGGDNFSSLTPEEHKANLEQSGLNVVEQMEAMSELNSVNAILDLMDLMEATNEQDYALAGVMQPVVVLGDGVSAAFDLKSTMVDGSSLSQLFNEDAGIYTYNATQNTWDEEASDDEITYHFPTEGSDVNNATLSLTNFTYVTVTNPDLAEVSDELPATLDVGLTVDGEILISFSFAASYDDDGIPTSISESWTLEKYNLTTSVSRSSSKIEIDQAFSYNQENILSSHFSNSGSFNYDEVMEDVEGQDLGNQDVLNSSNAWIAIDNLKLEGTVNWKGLAKDYVNIGAIESDQEYAEKSADILNENMSLKLKYHDSNEVIATGEAYAYVYEDYFGDSFWDVDLRMKFSDGSYMDDSFFGEDDFVELIESVEEMINGAEENYDVE